MIAADEYEVLSYDERDDPVVPSTKRLLRFRDIAVRTAYLSNFTKHQHGAVLFRGPRVYSLGFNTSRVVGWTKNFGVNYWSMHAELACLHGMSDKQLKGADLMVVRVDALGRPTLSKPCEKCFQMMALKSIRRCYYSLNEHDLACRTIAR